MKSNITRLCLHVFNYCDKSLYNPFDLSSCHARNQWEGERLVGEQRRVRKLGGILAPCRIGRVLVAGVGADSCLDVSLCHLRDDSVTIKARIDDNHIGLVRPGGARWSLMDAHSKDLTEGSVIAMRGSPPVEEDLIDAAHL